MSDVLVAGGIFREVLSGETREVRLAGSGLYAASAAAKLGANVTLIAPVGEDDADLAIALCEQAGVRPMLLLTRGASATFATRRRVGARPRPQYRPAEGPVPQEDLDPVNADVLVVFGHPEWEPLCSATVQRAAARATLLFDRQGWLSRCAGVSAAIALPAARRIQIANADELIEETDGSPRTALNELPPSGFVASVIKDGPWGVHIYREALDTIGIPAFAVEVRQTIGSGDVFAGVLGAALADGASLPTACELATGGAAAWISSDAALPADGFPEALRALQGSPRLPLVAPERLRSVPVRIAEAGGGMAAALLERVRRLLDELGAVSVVGPPNPDTGVALQLDAHHLLLDDGTPEDSRELMELLAGFLGHALS